MGRKTLILGYFGYKSGQLDGQTIKTRNIQLLLKKKLGNKGFKIFDTQDLQYSKLAYLRLASLLLWCNTLVYLPGKNNLVRLQRWLACLIKIRKTRVYYIVVGGWLSSLLKNNCKLVNLLKKFKYIGVESNSLAATLKEKYQLSQAEFFPNFRIHNFRPPCDFFQKPLKLVFMARVMPEKGVDELFKLAKIVDDRKLSITITFYGPVSNEYKEHFLSTVKKYNCSKYEGVLRPNEIYSNISQFDALVLPTRYLGEGFPGSILDAYIAGLPVIVSNWLFLPEFVEQGKSGFIVDSFSDLLDRVMFLADNPDYLASMKKIAYNKSQLYSSESAWQKLEDLGV